MSAASDADKGVVRTFLEAWSEGDLDRAFALTDPHGVVWMLSFGGTSQRCVSTFVRRILHRCSVSEPPFRVD
jgi:ketosteroid isomerase-like protein